MMDQAIHDQGGRTSAEHIAFSVLRALAEQRLSPGMRLTEDDLGAVFDVSRTIVRQALTQLAAHGIVGVRPKKGWYIIEPPEDEIRDVFAARRLLEAALIRDFTAAATPAQLKSLQDHLRRQHDAIAGDDPALRTHLLTDFHVRIAEILGNAVVTRMIRDLTMRTNLISMLYQTGQDASASCAEHEDVIKAVKARDANAAARLMVEHLYSVENGLRGRRTADPVHRLREALIARPPAAKSRLTPALVKPARAASGREVRGRAKT
jgi:DNA-binding GntR family transcriptional regulator